MSSAHKVTFIKRSEMDHTARCQTCGWTPDVKRRYVTRQMVEDEVAKHHAENNRVKMLLRSKVTSLEKERDHAEAKMNDPNVPDNERSTWRILYEDLSARCGHTPTPEEQPELPLGL